MERKHDSRGGQKICNNNLRGGKDATQAVANSLRAQAAPRPAASAIPPKN